jgi:hypothetical protein
MQANNADDEELSRKRQRNRVAQQKYSESDPPHAALQIFPCSSDLYRETVKAPHR